RARVVHGDADFGREVMAAVTHGAYALPWKPQLADEIRDMRQRLEASGSDRDVKRGFGGIIDVEFTVQMFRLKYGRTIHALRNPSTWETLDALWSARLLSPAEYATLRTGYDFLRLVESRLRIVHNRSLDELPQRPEDLEKLARRLGFEAGPAGSPGNEFLAQLDRHQARVREVFLDLMARERGPHARVPSPNGSG